MYGSFRFYIDEVPADISADSLLKVLEMFSEELGISYDHILYWHWEPEKDGMLINRSYSFDEFGKQKFLDTYIRPVAVGPHGDMSAPFIGGGCIGGERQIYQKIEVWIEFPCNSMPLTIKLNFEQKYLNEKMTFQKYISIVERLLKLGYHVNNGYYDVYSRKNTAVTLDGGQIGSWTNFEEKRNLNNSRAHRRAHCLNHVMDIFCANSAPKKLLTQEKIAEIRRLVGENNVTEIGDIINFSLPAMGSLKSMYRIRCWREIKKLRLIFAR